MLSGVQPSGSLHLGNYLGALRQWVELSKANHHNECLFCVVDLHAITQPHTTQSRSSSSSSKQSSPTVREETLRAAAIYLAAGVNVGKDSHNKIFVQSHVSAHSELMWILSCVTPINWLTRMTQFKDKTNLLNANMDQQDLDQRDQSQQQHQPGLGLLSYPILMAADILLYDTDLVPVGAD